MSGDEEDHGRYRELAAEMAVPDNDLPSAPGNDEVYTEYLPPQQDYHPSQRGEPEPQQRQQPQQQQPQQQQQLPTGYLQVPPADDDPIGHFDSRMYNSETWQQHQHAQDQHRQIWNGIDKSEVEMSADLEPGDYPAATEHLKATRMTELYMQLPDTPQADAAARQGGYQSAAHWRHLQLQDDAKKLAEHAWRIGMTPAQLYYQAAIHRGYKPKTVMTKTLQRNVHKQYDGMNDAQEKVFWNAFKRASQEVENNTRDD